MTPRVVSITGGVLPRRRRRRTRAQRRGTSGVGTGFAWHRYGQTIAVYCLDLDRLTVQAVTDMATSPDEIAVFLRAWQAMPACRPPDRDEDETLKVTIDLTAERARSEIVEIPWQEAKAAIIGFGKMPDLASRPRRTEARYPGARRGVTASALQDGVLLAGPRDPAKRQPKHRRA